jgi:excisionase family DNA binding protein
MDRRSAQPSRHSTAQRHTPTQEDRTMSTDLDAPVLYRVTDAMRVLSISRTVIFDQIRSGRLRSVKQGRTRLIPASAIRAYVELLEREAEAA